MEIEESNRLIAEFMGVKIGVDDYMWRVGSICKLKEVHLSYHKEWGWLMPVVEKIESLIVEVSIKSKFYDGAMINFCYIFQPDDMGHPVIEIETESDSKIR